MGNSKEPQCDVNNNHLSVQDQLVRAVKIRICLVTQLPAAQGPIDGLVVNNSPFITDTFTLSLKFSHGWFYTEIISLQYDFPDKYIVHMHFVHPLKEQKHFYLTFSLSSVKSRVTYIHHLTFVFHTPDMKYLDKDRLSSCFCDTRKRTWCDM